MGVETELRELIAELLDVTPSEISDESSPLTLPAWDSLNHLKLIVAIEERFGVAFSTPEVVDIRNFADIKQMLRAKGLTLGT
jgi:acyl carrier protein